MGIFDNLLMVVRIGLTVSTNSQCKLKGYDKGWFFARDVDFGASNLSSVGETTESDTGSVKFDILKIEKDVDSCSPQLLSACCKGGNLKLVEIHFVQTFYRTETGENSQPGGVSPVFIARFEEMNLSEWTIDSGKDSAIPKETIKLDYQKVAIGWVNQTNGSVIGRGWERTEDGKPIAWNYQFKARGRNA
jgi:type VI protein secretion system component Hcp